MSKQPQKLNKPKERRTIPRSITRPKILVDEMDKKILELSGKRNRKFNHSQIVTKLETRFLADKIFQESIIDEILTETN